ncbi:Gfo/Idh/MocA family oxidoreductase [Limnochorda pilosa]|uniref:hypothetical protein n=1 Tax=Limnochorda pilosa TaxID=1555112 RepID=UPI000836EAD9|nr:hypothetical protein [Limnochorda pilosa]
MNVALWAEEGPWREALAAWAHARNGRLVAMGGDVLEPAARAPGAAPVLDVEGLLRQDAVEAVHLMAPPARVPPLVRACLQAGRHVLLASPPPPDPTALEDLVRRGGEGEAMLLPVGSLAPSPRLRRVLHAAGKGMVGPPRLLEVRAEQDPARDRGPGDPGASTDPRAAAGGVLLRLGPPSSGNSPASWGNPCR